MTAAFRSLRALAVFTILTGMLYPFGMTVGARVLFPDQANGSLVKTSDGVVGSELIGQSWVGPEWFYGRPSAIDYDASTSAGRNLGPTSQALADQFVERVAEIQDVEGPYRVEVAPSDIPVDLITMSGSGLDPHISVDAAYFQAPRISAVRGLSEADVRALIEEHTEPKTLGVWGQERVNVLELNLALLRIART